MIDEKEEKEQKEQNAAPEAKNDRVMVLMLTLCFVLLAAIIVVQFLETPSFKRPVYVSADSAGLSEEDSVSASFPIGINSATYDEIKSIPGIGPSTAKLILKYREENGTIVSLEELLSIEGIGEKTIELLSDYCIVD